MSLKKWLAASLLLILSFALEQSWAEAPNQIGALRGNDLFCRDGSLGKVINGEFFVIEAASVLKRYRQLLRKAKDSDNRAAVRKLKRLVEYYLGAIEACERGTYGGNGKRPQCSDGIDNDGDGGIDYPDDSGCTRQKDNNETDGNNGRICGDNICEDGEDEESCPEDCRSEDEDLGLIGYWNLDESSGTVADDSSPLGYNDGSVSGATFAPALLNNGLAYDQTTDLTSVPLNGLNSESLSVVALVYSTTTSGVHYVFGHSSSLNSFADRLQLYTDGGKVGVGCGAAHKAINPALPLPSNEWALLAVTLEQGVVKLYRNGDFISEANCTGFNTLGNFAHIGNNGNHGATPEGWAGLLDEVRLYNRTLTQDEIQSLNDTFDFPSCGDGTVDSGEECDDGNSNNGDGCNSNCQLENACSDGIDNDSDGAIDGDDYACALGDRDSESAFLAQCQDGIDNDSNGVSDFPADVGCLSLQDNTEQSHSHGNCDCEFIPTWNNTGPTTTDLTQMPGLTITQDGAVYEHIYFTSGVVVKADNVTIRNSVIDANDIVNSSYALKVDSTASNFTCDRCEIREAQSALLYLLGSGAKISRSRFNFSGADHSKFNNHIGGTIFELNYYGQYAGDTVGSHADGGQAKYGNNVTLRCNTFDMPIEPPDGYASNSNFILETYSGPIDNILIECNQLCGGNNTIYLSDDPHSDSQGGPFGPPTNVRILNNTFCPEYRYGLLNSDSDASDGLVVCGNKMTDGSDAGINVFNCP